MFSRGGTLRRRAPLLSALRRTIPCTYEEGGKSNGGGQYLFVGRTGTIRGVPSLRRTIISFDVASAVPSGATITDVQLRLNRNKGQASHSVSIHRLITDWGEGTRDASSNEGNGGSANSGDATWVNTFLGSSNWASPGGDFVGSASASVTVGPSDGSFTWDSDIMVTDVQGWLDGPSTNFGWILKHVNETTSRTAQRFSSRQNGTVANRPQLIVHFSVPQPTATPVTPTATLTPTPEPILCGDANSDGQINVVDGVAIMQIIAGVITPTDDQTVAADIAQNGSVDVNDAILMLQFFVEKVGSLGDCGPLGG